LMSTNPLNTAILMLPELRTSLTDTDIVEFDAKYGNVLSEVRESPMFSLSRKYADQDPLSIALVDMAKLWWCLEEKDAQEFKEKYGHVVSTINAHFTEKRKRLEEESIKRYEEANARCEEEMKRLSDKYEMDIQNSRKLEEANDAAFDDLCENAKSLEEFYAYYGIEDAESCDPVKCSDVLINKIGKFSCDQDTYYKDVRMHFLRLLRNHPDKRVSLASALLFKSK